jgi:hypothetical protein
MEFYSLTGYYAVYFDKDTDTNLVRKPVTYILYLEDGSSRFLQTVHTAVPTHVVSCSEKSGA